MTENVAVSDDPTVANGSDVFTAYKALIDDRPDMFWLPKGIKTSTASGPFPTKASIHAVLDYPISLTIRDSIQGANVYENPCAKPSPC